MKLATTLVSSPLLTFVMSWPGASLGQVGLDFFFFFLWMCMSMKLNVVVNWMLCQAIRRFYCYVTMAVLYTFMVITCTLSGSPNNALSSG